MFNIGDKVIAKTNFLLEHSIPSEYREFEIVSVELPIIKLRNKQGFEYTCWYEEVLSRFYSTSNVNYELIRLIEKDNIEFTYFYGVTVDGKIINIQIPK